MVGGALLAGQVYGTQSQPQYDPGQSGVAERMLHQLHVVSPPSESVLIQSRAQAPAGTLTAAPALTGHVREAAGAVVAALRALPGAATDIQSPFGPGGRHLIGPGGSSALVTFQVAGPHSQADARVVRALAAVAAIQSRYPDLIVAETGSASVDRAATAMLGRDFHQAELTSVPLTLLLLLLIFGALIAASIPVILAGTAVITTVSLLAIPSRWLPIGQGTSEVVLIIGMAVGIDYTLFYLRREREERAAGATFHDALRTAAATSGRAIVVSGLTVMISLAGLLFTGIDMFTGFAIGTMMVVGVAVVGSLTALPALLVAARTVVGPGQGPVPRQGQDAGRAIQAVACRGRPRSQAACRLGWRRAARARRARRPRTRDADRQPRYQPAVEPARGADARGDPARLPWRSSTRPGRRGRARRTQPRHAAGDHRHRSGSGGGRPGARAGDRPARRTRQRPADLGAARGHRGRRQLEPRRRSRDCERCAVTSCLARSARSAGSATP